MLILAFLLEPPDSLSFFVGLSSSSILWACVEGQAIHEGKRNDIFSPATPGRALKLLPTIFLQRASEEEEAREGEGAFSQILGCLDVKDAFLQVQQDLGEEKSTWEKSWSKSVV